jgi:pimeloyl-ACP methyl ester carboxylesterase
VAGDQWLAAAGRAAVTGSRTRLPPAHAVWRDDDGAGRPCIKAFSETAFTKDLKQFDVPALVLHRDDDQIVPIGASALLSSRMIKGATLQDLSGRAAWPVLDP